MVIGARAAEVFEEGQVLLDEVGETIEELVLVDGTVGAAFARSTVVRDQHDHRVVQLAAFVEVVEQATDLMVGMAQETGVHFGHPAEQALFVVGQRCPRPHDIQLRPRLGAVRALFVDIGVDRR